jgi:DNA-binding MarR family transcriptional regulator
MTSTLTPVGNGDDATTADAAAGDVTEDSNTDDLDESADIAAAVIDMIRQFSGIKSRVTAGPDGDHSPMFLLVKLAHHGPKRASDLAELICADPSTVSRQVASLVKGGLLERRADPDDGRASILVPTELGRQRIEEYGRRRAVTMKPVIADWSAQDRQDLLRLLRKYTAGIETHREEIVSLLLEQHGRGPESRKKASASDLMLNTELRKEDH